MANSGHDLRMTGAFPPRLSDLRVILMGILCSALVTVLVVWLA